MTARMTHTRWSGVVLVLLAGAGCSSTGRQALTDQAGRGGSDRLDGADVSDVSDVSDGSDGSDGADGADGADCDLAKINFPQENPKAFEFYELCVPKSAADAEAKVKAVDPTLYCGVAGSFVGCDKTLETGCHGDLDYKPGSKVISDAKWAQICQLSNLPFVSKIGGGHYVQ